MKAAMCRPKAGHVLGTTGGGGVVKLSYLPVMGLLRLRFVLRTREVVVPCGCGQ